MPARVLFVALLLLLLPGCFRARVNFDPGNAQGYGGGDTVFAAVGRVSVRLARAARQIQAGEDLASLCRPQSCGFGNDPLHCQRLASLTPVQVEACRDYLVAFAGQYAAVLGRSATSLVDVVTGEIEIPDGAGRTAVVTAKAPLGEDGKVQINFFRGSQLSDHALAALLTHEVGHTFNGPGSTSARSAVARRPKIIRDEDPIESFSNGSDFLTVAGMALDVYEWAHGGHPGSLDTAYDPLGYKLHSLRIGQFEFSMLHSAFLSGGALRMTAAPSSHFLPPTGSGEEGAPARIRDFWITPTAGKVDLEGIELPANFETELAIESICAYGQDDARVLMRKIIRGEQSTEESLYVRRLGPGGRPVAGDIQIELEIPVGTFVPQRALTCLPGGKSVVGFLLWGEQITDPTTIAIHQFLPNGGRDSEFGTNGKVSLPAGDDLVEWIDLLPGAQGDLRLFLRQVRIDGPERLSEVRLDARGHKVADFGDGGTLSLRLPQSWFPQLISSAVPGSRYVLSGLALNDSVSRLETLAFEADGKLPASFGNDGLAEHAFVEGQNATLAQQIVDTEGRIVLSALDEFNRLRVTRYLSNGKLDPLFGGNGIVTLAIPFAVNRILGLERQGDRLLVALLTIIKEKYEVAYLRIHY